MRLGINIGLPTLAQSGGGSGQTFSVFAAGIDGTGPTNNTTRALLLMEDTDGRLWLSGGNNGPTNSWLPAVHNVASTGASLSASQEITTAGQEDEHSIGPLLRTPGGNPFLPWSSHNAIGSVEYFGVSVSTNALVSGLPVSDTNFRSAIGVSTAYVRAAWRGTTTGRMFTISRAERRNIQIVEWQPDMSGVLNSETLILTTTADQRPYVFGYTEGNITHLAMSEDNPFDGDIATCGIRYMRYDDSTARFEKSDGTLLSTLADVIAGTPIDLADLEAVYTDTGSGMKKAWPTDVVSVGGTVQVLFFAYPDSGAETYLAKLSGSTWTLSFVCKGTTDQGVIKTDDLDTIYTAAPGPYEDFEDVYRLTTTDSGATWGDDTRLTNQGVPDGVTPRTAGSGEGYRLGVGAHITSSGGQDVLAYGSILTGGASSDPFIDTQKIYALDASVAAPAVALSLGITTGGAAPSTSEEIALAAFDPHLWADPSQLATLAQGYDGSTAVTAVDNTPLRAIMSRTRRAFLRQYGDLVPGWRNFGTFSNGSIGMNTRRNFFSSAMPITSRFVFSIGLEFLATTSDQFFGFSDFRESAQIGTLLKYNGASDRSWSAALNQGINPATQTAGTTTINSGALSAVSLNIVTIYGDGTNLKLRVNGSELASETLTGRELWGPRQIVFGAQTASNGSASSTASANAVVGGIVFHGNLSDPAALVTAAEAWLTSKT